MAAAQSLLSQALNSMSSHGNMSANNMAGMNNMPLSMNVGLHNVNGGGGDVAMSGLAMPMSMPLSMPMSMPPMSIPIGGGGIEGIGMMAVDGVERNGAMEGSVATTTTTGGGADGNTATNTANALTSGGAVLERRDESAPMKIDGGGAGPSSQSLSQSQPGSGGLEVLVQQLQNQVRHYN